jgi:hypothetical protein
MPKGAHIYKFEARARNCSICSTPSQRTRRGPVPDIGFAGSPSAPTYLKRARQAFT